MTTTNKSSLKMTKSPTTERRERRERSLRKTRFNPRLTKKVNTVNTTTIMIALVASLFGTKTLAANLTPEEGLKRITKNIETSSKNKEEYLRATKEVEGNLSLLEKAKGDLTSQRKKLSSQQTENKQTLQLHNKKLQELDKSRSNEEKLKAEDLLKIQKLEKMVADLKALVGERQKRLTALEQDRTALEQSKKQGEGLQLNLAQEIQALDQKIGELSKEMGPWKTKKGLYEKESARWHKELERHQKMESEVKVLDGSAS